VSFKLRLATMANATVQEQYGDGSNNEAVADLEPMLKIALEMVSEARRAVRSRMTPDQIEKEERGETKPASK
jgi:hypothetical protein